MANHSLDKLKVQLLAFLFLIFIFLLNDLSNIWVRDYVWWMAIDYIFAKLLPISLIFILIKYEYVDFSDFGLKGLSAEPFIFYTVLLCITGIIIDQAGWRLFMKILPHTQLGSWPKIENPALDKIDFYFGLVLVGIIEEMIFRGFCVSLLRKYLSSAFFVFFLASLIFGFIHWSLGLHAVITTALWGILPLVVMWKTGSVIPSVLAHILTNMVSFSGIIPQEWFTFLS
ncbi:MAG: CPBP family intramembrane metalloprotease [Deltaproteobacteria bacterium]|nr:CPBP family intramembrane metalloprotease [Deltaproteobacteria bacterium]